MLKIIVGNEPYWVDSEIRKCISGIECPEMDLLKGDRLTDAVFEFLGMTSYLSSKKAAVITVADLSDADVPALKDLVMAEGNDLIIRARTYDQRKTFFKEMSKKGCVIACTKSACGKKLETFISKKAAEHGLTISPEAMRELLFLENYQDAEEVTCYTILSDICSLAEVSDGTVTPEVVRRIVPSHIKGNAFVVAGMIGNGNVRGVMEQAEALKGQEIASLAALLREYRISYKASFNRLSEIGVARRTLELSRDEAANGIRILTEALRAAKSDSPKASILEETYLRLLSMHKEFKESAV